MASTAGKVHRAPSRPDTSGGSSRVYLCFGEDAFSRGEAVEELISSHLEQDSRVMNLNVYEGKGLQASTVRSAIETYPFFGGSRVTVVRNAFDMAEAEQTSLAELCGSPLPEHATLILTSEGVDRRRKLYTTVARTGTVHEFKDLKGADLREWLRGRLKRFGVSVSREAGEYLLERDSGDLRGLENDLEKISLRWLGEARMLSLGDIRDLVGGVPEKDVFQLLDELSKRQRRASVEALRACLESGNEPLAVLAMVARQLRTMLFCLAMSGQRASTDEIAAVAKVHRYSAQLCQGHARNFSEGELMSSLVKLAELDLAVKTGGADAREGLELFVLGITG